MTATAQPTTEPTTADRLLDAVLPHVPFDGWSQAALSAALRETGIDPALARALYPRGGVDLALAWHRRGDAQMVAALAARDLTALRLRERVLLAMRLRLLDADRETVRRGVTLFALPHLAVAGGCAMWGTADAIWTALGDTSEDGNWYTKRAILAGVWSAVVLFWLGDQSPDSAETWAFAERRVEDVMRFERAKAKAQNDPVMGRVLALPFGVLRAIRRPVGRGMPGTWRGAPSGGTGAGRDAGGPDPAAGPAADGPRS